MNAEFIAILKKLISEQGREILFNPNKCKSFLTDYTHNEYKKENRLLLQALEAGFPKAIDSADDITICKKQQIKILSDEYFIKEEISSYIFDILLYILKDEKKIPEFSELNCNKSGKLTDKKKLVHLINIFTGAAILHGGDKHGPYFSNGKTFYNAAKELASALDIKIENIEGEVKRIKFIE